MTEHEKQEKWELATLHILNSIVQDPYYRGAGDHIAVNMASEIAKLYIERIEKGING